MIKPAECAGLHSASPADQIMIHSYNCSDLPVSIATESVSLDHRLVLRRLARICERKRVFHPGYHKPRTC